MCTEARTNRLLKVVLIDLMTIFPYYTLDELAEIIEEPKSKIESVLNGEVISEGEAVSLLLLLDMGTEYFSINTEMLEELQEIVFGGVK